MKPPMHDRDGQFPDPIAAHAAEIRTACARHSVSSLALVGSAARADFDPSRSDIDVLVDFVDGDINYFRAFMGLRKAMGGPRAMTAGELRQRYQAIGGDEALSQETVICATCPL